MTERFLAEHPRYSDSPLFLVIPEDLDLSGQRLPAHTEIIRSTHPHLTKHSFTAGYLLQSFLRHHAATTHTVITLLSGGASALVEDADDPDALITEYRHLLYSGLPIQEINRRRIAASRIKGGKLTAHLPEAQWLTFVMSDIPAPDGYRLVGSMPTYQEHTVRHTLIPVADGTLLHEFCANLLERSGYRIVFERRFLTGTVEEWCALVTEAAKHLSPRETILITGEPTVAVTTPDPGRGGRMGHLALLLAEQLAYDISLSALSSDGIDGNSPYAGVIFSPNERKRFERPLIADHCARFDAYSFFEKYGCAVRTGHTGINLNDVVIVTRD